jgi:hypothetical protein
MIESSMGTSLPPHIQVREIAGAVSNHLRPRLSFSEKLNFVGCSVGILVALGLSLIVAAAATELLGEPKRTWVHVVIALILAPVILLGPVALLIGLFLYIRSSVGQVEIEIQQGWLREIRRWGPYRKCRASIATEQISKLAIESIRSPKRAFEPAWICVSCKGGESHRIANGCGGRTTMRALLDDLASRCGLPVEACGLRPGGPATREQERQS